MQPVEVANNALLQMAHQVNFFCKVKIKKKKVKIKGEHSSSGEKKTQPFALTSAHFCNCI